MQSVFLWILTFIFTSQLLADVLKIGIVPYTDSLKIIKIHQPLRIYLEKSLDMEVQIFTSKSYEDFYEDSKNGFFDVIITGPHFGVLHLEDGFLPLYRYNVELKPIFVVLKDAPYYNEMDLKNKQIALSNYLSVSSMGGVKSLIESGFKNGIDFKLFNAKSHTSAIASVLIGESAAAITTYTPLKQMTDQSILEKVRFFETKMSMPHLFTIAYKNIQQPLYQKLILKFKQFEYSPQGIEFFKSTGYVGYTEITPSDIANLTSLLEETTMFLAIKEHPHETK